jgi:hypothetical protein
MFGGDQIKSPKLGIVHDFFAQRSAPARDHLNHRLHLRLDSAGNHYLCNVCLGNIGWSHGAVRRYPFSAKGGVSFVEAGATPQK